MVISVPGEFYIFETDIPPTREELAIFFQDLGENDILEVHITSPDNERLQNFHVNQVMLKHNLEFADLTLRLSIDTFEMAARTYPYNVPLPVIDQDGNCVNIIKKIKTYYDHYYHYEGGPDLTLLNKYDSIVLKGLNEYSAELYKMALPHWSGSEVILMGEEWIDYIEILPAIPNLNISVAAQTDELPASKNRLTIIEGYQQNEDLSRYKKGLLYYDEVMTLTFMFSYVIHPGIKNPGTKFFLIDGFFKIEGIFGIWLKVFTAARYAASKGYIPIFKIVSSDANIYSDYECDDIWNKFFLQPYGYTIQEVQESSCLTLSPNMNILNTLRYIMDQESQDRQLSWPYGIYNAQIRNYIQERAARFLPYPERTLGVLLRGTDYVKTHLPGHASHASPEMVINKITEIENEWDFDYIYLSTEDADICKKMKEHYGDRITFTDQERYTVKEGQFLVDLHQNKEPGKGFRLGAEYLCSIDLLSSCNSLIASGPCGALGEAVRRNSGKYKHVFSF